MLSRSAIVCLLAALATAACDRQSPAPTQANVATPDEVTSDEVAPDDSPAVTESGPKSGEADRSHKGEPAPALAFKAPDGKPTTLAAFRGKPVLLNLWATWCAPCVREMPSLDATAAALDGKVQVFAVSQDMDTAKVAPFFADRKLARLTPYADPDLGLSLHYKANLPTTILYDAQGNEVWRVLGALDWTGEKARALIAEAG